MILLFPAVLAVASCAKKSDDGSPNNCAPDKLNGGLAGSGSGLVFQPDPIARSGNATLSPTSVHLDDYRSGITLSHLGGHGVLEGAYVDVRNGTGCNGWFGAYEPSGQFSYSHGDSRFQEVMAYYYGDSYRASLDPAYLQPSNPVKIVAHCEENDNAYFMRQHDPSTGQAIEYVCLGDSVKTPGASYADDAIVTVHELQHATTVDTYSVSTNLNQLFYDEAGSLNEAISDFMGLMFEEPLLPAMQPPLDARLFSRWALGTFIPNHPGTRGAHKCPTYDPSYPSCTGFPGFSGTNNTISYVYPDGVGWPYANNFAAPGYASSAFQAYLSQEEIHNAGVLMEGALWDVYDALKANHGGDEAVARNLSTKLVLEALKHLPTPTTSLLSPVTFRAFASQLVSASALLSLSSADQASIAQALTARGLLGGPQVDSGWLAVGPGTPGVSPGLRIEDRPSRLKIWLQMMTGNPAAGSLVPQGISTVDGQLDPNELDAVWFDLQNTSAVTAGGVTVTVTLTDPEVTFDPEVNIGYISRTQAQMVYGKVNGTAIVSALSSSNPTYNVPAGNSYFKTNPLFDGGSSDRGFSTAMFVRVSPTAAHGKVVHFQVSAAPSNGPTASTTFTATIN